MNKDAFAAKLAAYRAKPQPSMKPRWRYRWYTRQWHSVNQWPPKWGYVLKVNGQFVSERMQQLASKY